jgi:hypothetical protein
MTDMEKTQRVKRPRKTVAKAKCTEAEVEHPPIEAIVQEFEEANEEAARLPTPEASTAVPDLLGKSIAIIGHGVSLKDAMADALTLGSVSCLADEVWAIDSMGGTIYNNRTFYLRPLTSLADSPALSWIRDGGGVVYSCKEEANAPNVVRYPIEEVVQHIGLAYMNSSAACAVALAICGGAKKIKVYGLDATGKERGCLEFLLAKAIHSNISIEVSPSSVLFDNDIGPTERLVGFSLLEDPVCPVVLDGKLVVLARSLIKAKQVKS